MAKKHGSGISKKNFPGLKRVKNEEGVRVWEYQGKQFVSLKELDMVKNPSKYVRMNFIPEIEDTVSNMGNESENKSLNLDETISQLTDKELNNEKATISDYIWAIILIIGSIIFVSLGVSEHFANVKTAYSDVGSWNFSLGVFLGLLAEIKNKEIDEKNK